MKNVWMTLILIALVLAGCGRSASADFVLPTNEEAYESFTEALSENFQENIEGKANMVFFCDDFRPGHAEYVTNRLYKFDFPCAAYSLDTKTTHEQHIVARAAIQYDGSWIISEMTVE